MGEQAAKSIQTAKGLQKKSRESTQTREIYFGPGSPVSALILRSASCACGGGCPVCRSKSNNTLKISQPNDVAEIEADRVAEEVMRKPASPPLTGRSISPLIQRSTGHEAGAAGVMPAGVARVISGPGRPMEPALRTDMERRFGHDFSGVRLYTGETAERSARAIDAEAYTVGSSIVFGAGRFAPEADQGRRLLAHELAHVVQQSDGRKRLSRKGPGDGKDKEVLRRIRIPRGVETRIEFLRYAEVVIFGRVLDLPWILGDGTTEFYEDVSKHVGQEVHFVFRQSYLTLLGTGTTAEKAGNEAEAKRDYAELAPEDREKINEEIDKRYYASIESTTTLKIKEGETGKIAIWNSLRQQVLSEKREIEELPESIKKVLFAGGPDAPAVTPDKYAQILRVVKKMSGAQWSDYEKSITARTNDLDILEKSVDDYLAEQRAREAEGVSRDDLITKLWGHKDLYVRYHDHKKTIPGDVWAANALLKMEERLEADIVKAGFPGGMKEFGGLVDDYLRSFRTETVRIAMDVLTKYDSVLYKENLRYQDAAGAADLYQQLEPLRNEYAAVQKSEQAIQNALNSEPYKTGVERSRLPDGAKRPPEPKAAKDARAEGERHVEIAREFVQYISDDYPVLKEDHLPLNRRLDKAELARAANPQEMAALIKEHIEARREDIKKTQDTLIKDPNKVFSLDNLIKISLDRQQIDPESIFGKIVNDKIADDKSWNDFIHFLTAVIAIALTLLSFGTGAVAVAAAVGGFALGAAMAYQEFIEYEEGNAAYGTGLSSEEKSRVWLIVSVVGAAIDLGQAVGAVKLISPIAKTLEETGEAAVYIKALKNLQKEGQITESIARNAEQAGIAHAKAAEAIKDLGKTLGSRAYSFPGPFADPDVYKDLVKFMFYKFKEGGHDFLRIVAEISQARTAAKLGALSDEEIKLLKNAYREGKAFESEADLLTYMKRTHPMGEADPAALPRGGRTPIDKADKDPNNIRALTRENDSADILSQRGFDVEQNPKVTGTTRNPDYRINGKIFDCYSPGETKTPRGIWSYIEEEKILKGQTSRVVLNLQDWGGDLAKLRTQFADYPMAGLDEVIVILKDQSIFHLVP